MRDRMMVTFVLSHACPLKCNFCCSNKEVVGPGRIGRDMMEAGLIGFGRQAAVERFAFTGGDPFLFLDDITAALETARHAGVSQPFQIVTSAYWVKSRTHAVDTLGRLRQLGLDLVGLSYDRQHARWVTPQQIRDACAAAAELSIRVNLTGVFWEEGDRVELLLPDIAAHPGNVRVSNLPVAPIGEARKHGTVSGRSVPVINKLSCGQPGFYSLSIYPDGAVYPCCSGGFQIEGQLSCGNIRLDPPARILFRAAANFHVRLVKEFGWGLLYEMVARDAPQLLDQLPSLEDASGVCEICRDLNLTLAERLAPFYERIEIEYVRTRAEFEWRSLTGGNEADAQVWVEGTRMSLTELLEMFTEDRARRLHYLAGLVRITSESSELASDCP